MSTKTQSELSKFFGPVVATGAERICVRNLNNEFSCFKISKKIHSKETRREIKYFKFLKKRGILLLSFPPLSLTLRRKMKSLSNRN